MFDKQKYHKKYDPVYYSKNKPAFIAAQMARKKRHRLANKCRAVEMLGGICMKCGYNKCIAALDFHHPNNTSKRYDISDHLNGSWENVDKTEILKCKLLCANCHRELHYEPLEE